MRLAIAQPGSLQEGSPDAFPKTGLLHARTEDAPGEFRPLDLSVTEDTGQQGTHVDQPRSAILRQGQPPATTGPTSSRGLLAGHP